MKKLFKIKAFKSGFILGLVFCSIVQLLDYVNYLFRREELTRLSQSGLHIDIISQWGIPFPIFYGKSFMILGSTANILIAVIFSFLLGLTFKFIQSRIYSRRMS